MPGVLGSVWCKCVVVVVAVAIFFLSSPLRRLRHRGLTDVTIWASDER